MTEKREKISITKALGEVNLLDSLISKKIDEVEFVDAYQERNKKQTLKTHTGIEEFEKRAKKAFEEIEQMIEKRKLIKRKIIHANASTYIVVAGEEMPIAESLTRKTDIIFRKNLLDKLKTQYRNISDEVSTYKKHLDSQVEEMLIQNLGTSIKADKNDYENIAAPFLLYNEMRILDPLNVRELISRYDDYIERFIGEIEYALAESNARTEIEI